MFLRNAITIFLLMALGRALPCRAAEIPIEQDSPSLRDIRLIASRYAGCIHSAARGTAAKLVRTPTDDPAFTRILSRMEAAGTCGFVRSGIPFTPELTRAYLMEFAYFRDFSGLSSAALSNAPTIDYDADYFSPHSDFARRQIAIARFGDCLVRARPADALRALRFLPGSGSETGVLSTLSSSFAACAPTSNEAVRLTPATLRGAIASGAYHLGRAAAVENR